jgi:hypothetical protein
VTAGQAKVAGDVLTPRAQIVYDLQRMQACFPTSLVSTLMLTVCKNGVFKCVSLFVCVIRSLCGDDIDVIPETLAGPDLA